MEKDFQEHELQAPAPGLIERSIRQHVELTPSDQVALAQWYSSPAYQVFLKLSEGVIEKEETAHFQSWKDREKFELTGLVAVASRSFFEKLQIEVHHQVEEFAGEVDFARKERERNAESPESMIQRLFT
jgi:hypothetical protein